MNFGDILLAILAFGFLIYGIIAVLAFRKMMKELKKIKDPRERSKYVDKVMGRH